MINNDLVSVVVVAYNAEDTILETLESIKKSIEKDCIEWKEKNNSPFAVSISLGYVEYPHKSIGYSITPLLAEADSNLYFEKRRKKELQNK